MPNGWKWYGTDMDYFRQKYIRIVRIEGRRCYRIIASVDHEKISPKVVSKKNFTSENVDQIMDIVSEFCEAYYRMKREES
jgi:dihydrofolate reductase